MNRVYTFKGYSPVGNQNIGINVGGYTYLPLNFPVFMYEYGWKSGSPGPGSSSGYYVGILQYNSTKGLGYFLTTNIQINQIQVVIMIIIIQDLDGVVVQLVISLLV